MLGVLVGLSFVALAVFAAAALVASVATVLSARHDRRMAAELDWVLDEIVGPRSRPAATSAWSPPPR